MTENQDHTDETDESVNVRRMRDRIKELEASDREKGEALRLASFQLAGIDPESPGIGKAIFRTYEGEANPTAIVEFAKAEYGWQPPKPTASVSESAERINALDQASQVETPASVMDEAIEAAKSGDWAKSLALKAQELRQMAG